jgi:hypothetical protein
LYKSNEKNLKIKVFSFFNEKYSHKKIGEMLCNYLSPLLKSAFTLKHKDRAGWDKMDLEEPYDFFSSKNTFINNLPITYRHLDEKKEITSSKVIENYLSSLEVFKNPAHRLLIIAYFHYSLTYEFFKKEKISLSNILVLNGSIETVQLMKYFLQVFSRETDMSISMNCSNDELCEHIYSGKDEVLLFTDYEGDNNNVKNNKQTIINIFAKNLNFKRKLKKSDKTIMINTVATAAISSNILAYEIPNENLLLIDIDDTNFDFFKFIQIQKDKEYVSDQIWYFIDYVKNMIDQYTTSIRKNYIYYYEKAGKYDFLNESKIVYAVLMTILSEFIDYVEANNVIFFMNREETERVIVEYLLSKEEFGETEGITNMLKETIIKQIEEKKFNLVSQIKGEEMGKLDAKKPTIYYDEKYFFISKGDFDQYFISNLPLKITSNQVLQALLKDGYLRTYDTKKRSYEYKPIIYNQYGVAQRKSMVSIKRELIETYGELPIF